MTGHLGSNWTKPVGTTRRIVRVWMKVRDSSFRICFDIVDFMDNWLGVDILHLAASLTSVATRRAFVPGRGAVAFNDNGELRRVRRRGPGRLVQLEQRAGPWAPLALEGHPALLRCRQQSRASLTLGLPATYQVLMPGMPRDAGVQNERRLPDHAVGSPRPSLRRQVLFFFTPQVTFRRWNEGKREKEKKEKRVVAFSHQCSGFFFFRSVMNDFDLYFLGKHSFYESTSTIRMMNWNHQRCKFQDGQRCPKQIMI